jgi:RND family efflux transporter MFP subunit
MERKMRRKQYITIFKIIVLILGLLVFITGCRKDNTYISPPPPTVTVSRPVHQTVIDYLEFTGTTEAVESVEIRARVEGYLESIHFKDGVRVRKGDLLFVIEPSEYQAKLNAAKATQESAEATLKRAEIEFVRVQRIFKKGAGAETDVVKWRVERNVARASVSEAKAKVEQANLDLNYTKVRAPISGKVSRNLVDVGNLVGAGERTLLATIVKDDPIYTYFNVSERDLLYNLQKMRQREVAADENKRVDAHLGLANESGFPHEGYLDYVDNRVDADSGTIQARAVFPNSGGVLFPGLFARIRVLTGKQDNALLVPEDALGTDQQGQYLLVINDQNIVEYRSVRTGAQGSGRCIIKTGILPEDRVIVKGIQRVRPGVTVTPIEVKSKIAKDAGKVGNHD